MKKNKYIAVISGFISFFIIGGIIYSYDNKVAHRTFNEYIVRFAEENYENYFPSSYEINFTSDNTKYKGIAVIEDDWIEGEWFEITEGEEEYTILKWIIHGGYSADEPEIPASVRHFYDPVELVGVKYLTNEGTVWENHYPNPRTDAIEWAMGDNVGDINKWTLLKGKEFLVRALETTDEETKNTNIAKAFRCLGEVLHNTGDMGCPAHTRNDSHAAPIGYKGGAIFGSPDPYEEMFHRSYIPRFMEDDPDPDLKSFFDNATTIRSINEKLAEFTNANFFTEETMNGMGYELITPKNEEGTYPSPLLQAFDYNSDDYTYSKILPYNNFKIIMAKDKSYWGWGRTYPYIDRECVRNQAQYLVPNIICAGANVVRLFIPQFEVEIKSDSSSGEVEGVVIHNQTAEYSSEIAYSGKIFIYDNKNLKKIGEVSCQNGEFIGTVSNLGAYDEIYAELEMAGINIRSEIYYLNNKYTVTGCYIVVRDIDGNFRTNYPDDSVPVSFWSGAHSAGFPKEHNAIVNFTGTTLTQTNSHLGNDGNYYTGSTTINFDDDFENVLNFTVQATITNDELSWIRNSSLSGQNIPIDSTYPNIIFKVNGPETCSKITGMTWSDSRRTHTDTLLPGWTCNSDSEMEIWVFTM